MVYPRLDLQDKPFLDMSYEDLCLVQAGRANWEGGKDVKIFIAASEKVRQ